MLKSAFSTTTTIIKYGYGGLSLIKFQKGKRSVTVEGLNNVENWNDKINLEEELIKLKFQNLNVLKIGPKEVSVISYKLFLKHH